MDISKQNPIKCEVLAKEKKIVVYGIDVPFVLSQIVGLISLQGLEIEKATSTSFIIDSKDLTQKINCFKDDFIVNVDNLENELWENELSQLVESQCLLIYQNKRKKASQKIIECIAGDLSKNKNIHNSPPVLDIQIQASEIKKELNVIVQGEDSPYLLYMISSAIETQAMPIINFSINTQKGYIEDTFRVTAPNFSKMFELANIRVNLLLNTQFAFLLQKSPNPYEALIRFQEVISELKLEEENKLLDMFLSRSNSSAILAELLGSGDYLWEQFIRTQSHEVIKIFSDSKDKKIGDDPKDYKKKIEYILEKTTNYQEKIEALNTFKDDEAYFIDIDTMLRHNHDVKYLSERLSSLARVVVNQATKIAEKKLAKEYGYPYSSLGVKSDWALFGLGKFGGSALGYASDIELLFIYEDVGKTDGKNSISNYEYFECFVRELKTIIKARSDGIFKLDMCLRPYGEEGSLAVRLDCFIEYYQSASAHSVELLALTRMRPVAGTPIVAERVLQIKNNIVYQTNLISCKAIWKMREKQIETKVKKGTRNAKFGRGALVDVEYGVQMLQVQFGKDIIDLQQPSIHNALYSLQKIGAFSKEETQILVGAYVFYRKLINALRMRRGNAKDLTLPAEQTWELEHLARRMGYISKELSEGEQLILDFDATGVQIQEFIKNYFTSSFIKIANKEINNPAALVYLQNPNQDSVLLKNFKNPERVLGLIKHCARTGKVRQLFSRLLLLGWVRIYRNGDPELVFLTLNRLSEYFSDEGLITFYCQLLERPKFFSVLIDVFSTSRFLSEEIIKKPQSVFLLLNTPYLYKEKPPVVFLIDYTNFQNEQIPKGKINIDKYTQIQKNIIRDFRKQEILRIIIRDIFIKTPLSKICSEISNLAQTIIQKALEYSCKKLGVESKGIAIFAFGKLGAHELNYSSDIDIMCIYDEHTLLSTEKITELFRSVVQYLTDYTTTGIAYRVDLRLRPFGDGGDIISHFDTVKQYYTDHAQLWEIQASLKLSWVAGDQNLAQEVYKQIYKITKQRLSLYEKKTLFDEIHKLRKRSVEGYNKKHNNYEIKNSWGGIRDIEFSTQALQLLHYTTDLCRLNTIQALSSLKDKGIITSTEQQENTENYCFLRRVEHFLQVYEDKQLHAIPGDNITVIKKLSWLMLQEQDEDKFFQKLDQVKKQAYRWYSSVLT